MPLTSFTAVEGGLQHGGGGRLGVEVQLSHFDTETLIGQVSYISLNSGFLISEVGMLSNIPVSGCENQMK